MTTDHFDFSTTNQILFGSGKLLEVSRLITGYGQKAFVLLAPHVMDNARLMGQLEEAKSAYICYKVEGEPSLISVCNAVRAAKEGDCDIVVAVGGGSVLDTGKVVAAMLTNGGDLMDYLEVVGKGLPIAHRCAPFIAIPTTAGTGSEVTRNAVIDIPEKKVKVSMRSSLMLPWVAIIDPLLTVKLPSKITAYTGMDALVQVIEPYVSNRANWMTDMFCKQGIRRAAVHLREVYFHGDNVESRAEMCMVSLMGGMALANAGVGAVHGFAGVLGGMYHVPHGAICASLLPAVMTVNITALITRDPEGWGLARYLEIAKLLTGDQTASLTDGIQWAMKLCHDLNIPTLKTLGVQASDFDEIVRKTKMTSSLKSNPISLSDDELTECLVRSF